MDASWALRSASDFTGQARENHRKDRLHIRIIDVRTQKLGRYLSHFGWKESGSPITLCGLLVTGSVVSLPGQVSAPAALRPQDGPAITVSRSRKAMAGQ
jgi:hypothetical protein